MLSDHYHELLAKDLMDALNNKEEPDHQIILEDGLPRALGINNSSEVKFKKEKLD